MPNAARRCGYSQQPPRDYLGNSEDKVANQDRPVSIAIRTLHIPAFPDSQTNPCA